MKTVEVAVPFTDLKLGRDVSIGERYEVTDERLAELTSVKTSAGNPIVRVIDTTPIQETAKVEELDLTPPLKTEEEFKNEKPKKKPAKKSTGAKRKYAKKKLGA